MKKYNLKSGHIFAAFAVIAVVVLSTLFVGAIANGQEISPPYEDTTSSSTPEVAPPCCETATTTSSSESPPPPSSGGGGSGSTNNLPTLFNLLQWDGSTSIPEGWIVRHSSISFSANIVTHISAPNGALQVELRRFEEPFTGNDDGSILISNLVSVEGVARITKPDLTDGKYHWRARAIEGNTLPPPSSLWNTSPWQEFGSISNVDFEILTNQMPIADFTFNPSNPQSGESVSFDASISYDPDGDTISLYAWDWDGDGTYDEHINSPLISHKWLSGGVYNVGLKVVDSKGGIGIKKQEIVVKSPTNTATANILDAFCNNWLTGWICDTTTKQDELAEEIDVWLRDRNGDNNPDDSTKPFDWLKGTRCGGAGADANFRQKICLMSALNTEISNDGSGLTYKEHILKVIREERMVNQALQKDPIPYPVRLLIKLYSKISLDVLLLKGITSEALELYVAQGLTALGFYDTATPLAKFGTGALSTALTTLSIKESFDEIDDYTYRLALKAYFCIRYDHTESVAWEGAPADCSQNASAILATTGASSEFLSATRSQFDRWWKVYKSDLEKLYQNWNPAAEGLPEKFKRDIRKDIQNLIILLVKTGN